MPKRNKRKGKGKGKLMNFELTTEIINEFRKPDAEPDESIKKELAERIRYVRKNIAKQTQEKFAYSLYVSRVYINQLENAKIKAYPSEDFLYRICDKFEISYDWLCLGKEPILSPKYYSYVDYEMQHMETIEWRLTADEKITTEYRKHLNEELKNILDPEELSLEQYTELISICMILLRPFFQFSRELKELYLNEYLPIEKLFEKHYQELESTIKVFLSKES